MAARYVGWIVCWEIAFCKRGHLPQRVFTAIQVVRIFRWYCLYFPLLDVTALVGLQRVARLVHFDAYGPLLLGMWVWMGLADYVTGCVPYRTEMHRFLLFLFWLATSAALAHSHLEFVLSWQLADDVTYGVTEAGVFWLPIGFYLFGRFGHALYDYEVDWQALRSFVAVPIVLSVGMQVMFRLVAFFV